MTTRQKRIPDLFTRGALEYFEDDVHQVEDDNDHHTQVNHIPREHVSMAAGNKDTKILEEN